MRRVGELLQYKLNGAVRRGGARGWEEVGRCAGEGNELSPIWTKHDHEVLGTATGAPHQRPLANACYLSDRGIY